jgi:hypothetical protein
MDTLILSAVLALVRLSSCSDSAYYENADMREIRGYVVLSDCAVPYTDTLSERELREIWRVLRRRYY